MVVHFIFHVQLILGFRPLTDAILLTLRQPLNTTRTVGVGTLRAISRIDRVVSFDMAAFAAGSYGRHCYIRLEVLYRCCSGNCRNLRI